MTAPLLFTPLALRGLTLKNRAVVAPMHQYAGERGFATDWPLDAAQKLGADPHFQLAPPAAGWWLERRRAGAPGVLPSTFPSPT